MTMLRVENIDLFYGASQALKSVSLTASAGRVTAVMGRNGVGKTSLMRALTGRQPIKGGRILWDGNDIAKVPAAERAISWITSSASWKFRTRM